MALYKRPEATFWYYEFKIGGKRFRGTTKTADRAQAEAYEVLQRLQALKATQDAMAAAESAVGRVTLWDAAQSWLASAALSDHKGNLSRVRKLFGTEMRLVNDQWQEVPNQRFALARTVAVADVSPELLEELKEARKREGNSAGTIERELSLLRVLLVHAPALVGTGSSSVWPEAAQQERTFHPLN